MDLTRYRARKKTLSAGEMAEMLRDGLTLDELAEALGASVSTVTQRIHEGGWDVYGEPITRAPKVDVIAQLAIATVSQGDWALEALCAQTDPEIFFPEKGGSNKATKRICQRCPVAAECLDYALENNEMFGVWGGLSERERRALKAADTSLAVPCPEACGAMFRNDTNASRHAKAAHADIVCPSCGDTFANGGSLSLHARAAHPAAS